MTTTGNEVSDAGTILLESSALTTLARGLHGPYKRVAGRPEKPKATHDIFYSHPGGDMTLRDHIASGGLLSGFGNVPV